MYFLALFPAFVWIGAFVFRRRWLGLAIVLGGLLTALGTTSLLSMLAPDGAKQGPTILHLMAYAYSAVVTLVALLIVCQKRKGAAYSCATCDYDLRGNESSVCPECGKPMTGPLTPSLAFGIGADKDRAA